MRVIDNWSLPLAAAIPLALAASALAGGGHCAHCGCQAECHKVCRLVCEEKKVPVTCWGCKCEDFCLPGHSKRGCEHCEEVCNEDANDCDAPCTHTQNFVWTEWIPGCGAKLHTKKKLMKKTITKKVPSHKWVVEDLCAACQANCDTAAIQPPLPAIGGASGPIAATIGDGEIAPISHTSAANQAWYKPLLPTWKK
jgi:hypothetical protein